MAGTTGRMDGTGYWNVAGALYRTDRYFCGPFLYGTGN